MNKIELAVINWDDTNHKKKHISLTSLVEKNSEKIRKEYIDFIDNISNHNINSLSVNSALKIDEEFSLWWMSILHEKNFYKSPNIKDCLKIIALKDYLIDNLNENIHIINVPKYCKYSINQFTKNTNVKLIIQYQISNKFKYKVNVKIPFFIKSFYTLIKYYFLSLFFNKNKTNKKLSSNKEILIVSYFLNFDKEDLKNKKFTSDYWGKLIDNLKSKGYLVNWLHMFPTDNNPKYKKNLNNLNYINNTSDNENHYFLENYTTFRIFLLTLINYIKFTLITKKFANQKSSLNCKKNNILFWDLLKNDWQDSLLGSNLMRNILIYYQFSEFVKNISKQKKILYLHEGQGWEKALLNAVKKTHKSELIAVIQSPIRFWDIKIFSSLKNEKVHKLNSLTIPDQIAVNTYDGINMLDEYGVNSNKLFLVEPLRYKKITNYSVLDYSTHKIRILVLGGYLKELTRELLESTNMLKEELSFNFRSHPGYVIDIKNYNVTYDNNNTIEKSLIENDIVIVAGDSSVAIDAYLAKKIVIIYTKKGDLNYSPLRNYKDIKFISDKNSLRKYMLELNARCKRDKSLFKSKDIKKIYLESMDNKKWKNLLE